MGSRLGARRALVSLVVFGALAGCGDDSAVEVTATPVPTVSSATPEPSPTPTAPATAVPLPVMPPEMANNDAAGAEAAARYVVELIDYAYLNRDTAPLSEISDDDCVFCNGVIAEVEKMLVEDVRRIGGLLRVLGTSSVDYSDSTDAFFVVLELQEEDGRFVDGDGAVVGESTARDHLIDFVLTRAGGTWKILASGDSK